MSRRSRKTDFSVNLGWDRVTVFCDLTRLRANPFFRPRPAWREVFLIDRKFDRCESSDRPLSTADGWAVVTRSPRGKAAPWTLAPVPAALADELAVTVASTRLGRAAAVYLADLDFGIRLFQHDCKPENADLLSVNLGFSREKVADSDGLPPKPDANVLVAIPDLALGREWFQRNDSYARYFSARYQEG